MTRRRMMRTALVLMAALFACGAGLAQAEINWPACDTLEDKIACGKEALREGDLVRAGDHFTGALAIDPLEPRASFGKGFIIAAQAILEAVESLDRYSVGHLSSEEIDHYLKNGFAEKLSEAAYFLGPVEGHGELDFYMDRLLLLETGASLGLGTIDWDLGEAVAVRSVTRIATGALKVLEGLDMAVPLNLLGFEEASMYVLGGDLGDDAKAGKAMDKGRIVLGLDEVIRGLDDLIAAMLFVMAETDDQTDDLITQDLLRLQGDFVIPGVMTPVPVQELLAGFVDPETMSGWDMPTDAIELLRIVRGICELLQGVLG